MQRIRGSAIATRDAPGARGVVAHAVRRTMSPHFHEQARTAQYVPMNDRVCRNRRVVLWFFCLSVGCPVPSVG
jgi:hypothetical protein